MFPGIDINKKPKSSRDDKLEIEMHIDFNKKEKILYNNLYFTKYKYVLKMPLYSCDKECRFNDCKIEKFKLTNHVYFLHY